MSNNQLFDNNIKDQFEDYTPQVHPRIWENIVKKREKRRPVGFWITFLNGRNILLLTAFLISAGSGAYLLLKNPADNDQGKNTVTSNDTKNPESGTKATTLITEINNSNPEITKNSNDKTNTSLVNDNLDAVTEKSISGLPALPQATSSKIKTFSPFAQTGEENIASKYKERKRNLTAINNDYEITDADVFINTKTSENNFLNRILFPDLQKITTEKRSTTLNKRFLPNVFLPDCPSIEKNAAGNKTYIEVYGGPDIAFRSLSDTGNSVYLQKRKESTKFSSAYSVGLRYTKVFNNGMSIRTGINYSQINEKFTFVQGNLVQITYIIDANGDTTGSYITTGTRYKTTYNKFKTVDVPLLVGYEMGNGKFHANINAGIIINVYSWQKGDVLDASYKPVSITTGKTNSPYQFKTNIGMGFMAGASLYYKLNEKIHVLAEPYFRYSLAPMSKENLTFKQKYNTTGLRLGLRIDLH